jgi:hypothetical protein
MPDNPWLVYRAHYVVVSHLPSCGGRLLGGAPAAVWLLLALIECMNGKIPWNNLGQLSEWWCMVCNHDGELPYTLELLKGGKFLGHQL